MGWGAVHLVRVRRQFGVALFVLLAVVATTAPVAAEDAAGGKPFIWPTGGRITQPYGCTGFWMEPRYGSCRHFHGGIDIAASRGTHIKAAADGVITHAGWDPWGTRNWMVMIRHGNGFQTWYGHLKAKRAPGISVGASVKQGELIGYMGTTGMATGPHLHWAVLIDGRYADPARFVDGRLVRPPRRGRGSTAPRSVCRMVAAVQPGAATARVLEGDEPTTCAA